MLTPFCFFGIHVVTFGGEVHKLKEVCVYMPLFCVCNILSTIFSVKKEKKCNFSRGRGKHFDYFCTIGLSFPKLYTIR